MYRARWNFIFASAVSFRLLFVVVGVTMLGGVYFAGIVSVGQASSVRDRNGSVVLPPLDVSTRNPFNADHGAAEPLVIDPVRVRSTKYVGDNPGEATPPTPSGTLGVADHPFRTVEGPAPNKAAADVTWKGGQDRRWSNPFNWDGGRVPGASDVARFAATSNIEVVVDVDSSGTVASLIMEPGYRGTISLERDLTISNDLVLAGGTLDQGNHNLNVNRYRQMGGTFTGGDASLMIENEAVLSGGTLLSSRSMTMRSLTIKSPAVVTMAANSKLSLTGDGEPLNGDGLLDVTTHGPNSLEYTGRATADVTAAGPIKRVEALSGLRDLQMPPRLQNVEGAFAGESPARSQMPSLLGGLTSREPEQALSGTFSRNGALTMPRNEEYPWAAAIDTVNGFAYFGTLPHNGPGIVVKVRLSDFTRVGALVLDAGDDPLRCATIDTVNGFAYFGGLYGDIIKVRLSDFTRVGAIETGAAFASAVIDTDNGFAYFGGYTSPGAVFKVRLSDFTSAGSLSSGASNLRSATIDTPNGYAYFGGFTGPGQVVKIRLSDFARVGGVTLNAGEDYLSSAVVDPANGFAYFGTGTQPGIVVMIDLGYATSTPGPRAPFDFDGDGKSDIGIFRSGAAAEWWISKSSDNGVLAAQFGAVGDIPTPADYTGDGKTDMAFFRPSTGQWFILRSQDFSFYGFPFGSATDTPAPADYDGDGRADAAVFRSGSWFILKSSDNGVRIEPFGVVGDKPVPADYDGDGKADLAIFRPSGGTGGEWWVNRSTAGLFAASFGSATDRTAVGDYTGDGKADCAFFRPSTGTWYVLRSEDQSFFGFPFGNSSDTPAPGDYDGDGKADAAVFRQPGAQWFVNRSSGGVTSLTFGSNGDLPVPGSYVR